MPLCVTSLFCISTDEFALAEVKQVQNEGICLILIELITEAEFIMLLIYRIGGWLMNLPNALTLFRFVLIGIFPYLYFLEGLENNKVWAFAVFILAGITDVLDGFIARRFNLITKWGKLMDPLADKLMLIVVLISLYTVELVPLIVIIIVLAKELLMVLGAIFIYRNRNTVVQSNIVGKSSSAAFYVAIIALVLNIPYAYYILGAAVILTIIALIQYGILNLKKPDRKVKSNLDNIS